jgi:hypothetical protein
VRGGLYLWREYDNAILDRLAHRYGILLASETDKFDSAQWSIIGFEYLQLHSNDNRGLI